MCNVSDYWEEVATEEGKEIGKEIGERQKIISLVVKTKRRKWIMKLKRIIAIACTAAMTVSLISGCGGAQAGTHRYQDTEL